MSNLFCDISCLFCLISIRCSFVVVKYDVDRVVTCSFNACTSSKISVFTIVAEPYKPVELIDIKEFELQERAGMGSAGNEAASCTYIEYGLHPPGRFELTRNREMVKKQVHTMATAKRIASGGHWYTSRRAAEGNNWPHSKRMVPWTKGGGHRCAQCVHLGAATGSQCAREGR
jgi:hypothetical protein